MLPESFFDYFKIIFHVIFFAITVTACSSESSNREIPLINSTSEPVADETETGISATFAVTIREDQNVDHNGNIIISGQLTTINQTNGKIFAAQDKDTLYGHFSLSSDGNWSYSVENALPAIQQLSSSQSMTDSIQVSTINNSHSLITITILGADEINTPAVIKGTTTGIVREDLNVDVNGNLNARGRLSITDIDQHEDIFKTRLSYTNYGRFIITPGGNWYYEAKNNSPFIQNLSSGQYLTETFTVYSIDGTRQSIRVIILGMDEPASGPRVTLSWTPPTTREDSNPISLSQIAGYKIRYGNLPGQYTNSVFIENGSSSSHIFTNLPANQYYFTVITVDTHGRESVNNSSVSIDTR